MEWFKKNFFASQGNISNQEKLLSGLLAFLCILCVGYISSYFLKGYSFPFLVASLGATAVLVFAAPHSPFSQPWPVIGSHIIAAFIGITVARLLGDVVLAAALALSLSIIVMYFSHSLHPPGGAVALGTVISWPDIQPLGYHYILAPIALNVVLIVIMGVLLTRLLTKRHYPMQHTGSNKTSLSTITTQWAMGPAQFTDSDLHEALGKMDSYVDVAEEDLAKIYALAVMNASKRRLGYVYCKDIMKESPLTFLYGEPIENAWQQMFDNNLKAATIVDSFMRPIGIVTTTDFMHHASKEDGKNLSEKFARLISSHHKDNPRKPEVVGQIMSSDPVTANLDQHIVDLVPSFTEKGFHHMPVVNDRGKLVGMITRSDLMRSMVLTRS